MTNAAPHIRDGQLEPQPWREMEDKKTYEHGTYIFASWVMWDPMDILEENEYPWLREEKALTRAEAHRQAMMAMIDSGPARNAHPALWAPFVVVGEGGEMIQRQEKLRDQQNQTSTCQESSVKVAACPRNQKLSR